MILVCSGDGLGRTVGDAGDAGGWGAGSDTTGAAFVAGDVDDGDVDDDDNDGCGIVTIRLTVV